MARLHRFHPASWRARGDQQSDRQEREQVQPARGPAASVRLPLDRNTERGKRMRTRIISKLHVGQAEVREQLADDHPQGARPASPSTVPAFPRSAALLHDGKTTRRIVPENVSRIEMRPGMSRLALRMSGLNIITGCAFRSTAVRLFSISALMALERMTPFAAASACRRDAWNRSRRIMINTSRPAVWRAMLRCVVGRNPRSPPCRVGRPTI